MITENEAALCEAVKSDLGKPETETKMMELLAVANEAVEQLEHLEEWSSPHKIPMSSLGVANKMDRCQIRREAKGVVLIIGAFNYPIQLSLMPLAGALAGGNVALMTPSEASGASAQLMADLISRY